MKVLARARTIYERWMEWECETEARTNYQRVTNFSCGKFLQEITRHYFCRNSSDLLTLSILEMLWRFSSFSPLRPDDNPWLQYVKFEERPCHVFFFSGCHWPESLWGFKSCPIDPELLCQFPGVASWTKHGRLGFGVGLDEVVMNDNFFFT